MSFILQVVTSVLLLAAPGKGTGVDQSLANEAQLSAKKALNYFASSQNTDGSWSMREHPALTGFVIRSFYMSQRLGIDLKEYDSVIQKGLTYIKSCVKPDGGIYVKVNENYNTAVCINALVASRKPEFRTIIINANNFLVSNQTDDLVKGIPDGEFDGGIGYNKTGHSDVNNTSYALEAVTAVKKMEEEYKRYQKDSKKQVSSDTVPTMNELNWDAAINFISHCQHLKETNSYDWVSEDSSNKGGFIYYPNESKAGADTTKDGKVIPRSYGTGSLCGLVDLLFLNVDKNDIRIKAVYDWLSRNYTLEENPGLGKDGMFFYYHMIGKALSLYDEDTFVAKGKKIFWRKELIEHFVRIQKNEGFWVNEDARWMENDPILSTSYILLALEMSIP